MSSMDQLKELMEPLISGIHEFYGSTEGTYETNNITKKLGQKIFDFLVNSFTTFFMFFIYNVNPMITFLTFYPFVTFTQYIIWTTNYL